MVLSSFRRTLAGIPAVNASPRAHLNQHRHVLRHRRIGFPEERYFGSGDDHIHPDEAFNSSGDALAAADRPNEMGLHIYDYANPVIDIEIREEGWNKHQAAVVAGNNGYLIVYENRSTVPYSYQHIYATRYDRGGVVLPIVSNKVKGNQGLE